MNTERPVKVEPILRGGWWPIPAAIAIAGGLIAGAVAVQPLFEPRYEGASGEQLSYWRLDKRSGEMIVCGLERGQTMCFVAHAGGATK